MACKGSPPRHLTRSGGEFLRAWHYRPSSASIFLVTLVHRIHHGVPFRPVPLKLLNQRLPGQESLSHQDSISLQLSDSAPKGKPFVIEVSLRGCGIAVPEHLKRIIYKN